MNPSSTNSKPDMPRRAPRRALSLLPRREEQAGERRNGEPPRRTLLPGHAANGFSPVRVDPVSGSAFIKGIRDRAEPSCLRNVSVYRGLAVSERSAAFTPLPLGTVCVASRTFPSAGKGSTVKRPEGRAPGALGWGAKHILHNSETSLPGLASSGKKRERCLRARIGAPSAAAFTLVELLTVIAVMAVMASLLMTAIASAKKKSRTAVCTFNLHQISLALNMYLDDFGARPQRVDDLVSGKYLPASRTLLCPEDKTGNWGQLVQRANSVVIGAQFGAPTVAENESVKYSYLLHPLSVDQATWDRLMRAGETAGVAACQLHGLGNQDVPDVHSFSGLLLRAQKDGAVVRRRLFWTTEVPPMSAVTSGFNPASSSSDFYSLQIFPLQIYLDDPTHWSENP